MNIYRFSNVELPISITTENTGYHHNQSDMIMTATIGENTVAALEFSVYQDEPYVNMIKVDEKYRRKGIATKLIRKLQEMFPDTQIHMGLASSDGSKLLESFPTKFIPNEEYNRLSKEKTLLNTRLDELQNFLDSHDPKTQREEMLAQGDEWNQTHDKIEDIERQLEDMKKGTTLIL